MNTTTEPNTSQVFDVDEPGDWTDALERMELCQIVQVSEATYWYFLEVLPPRYMGKTVRLNNGEDVRASYGFSEGWEPVIAFWQIGGRYFAGQTKQIVRD